MENVFYECTVMTFFGREMHVMPFFGREIMTPLRICAFLPRPLSISRVRCSFPFTYPYSVTPLGCWAYVVLRIRQD